MENPIIKVQDLSFVYNDGGDDLVEAAKIPALKNVSFEVFSGEYISILGHNGSGKSTFAKQLQQEENAMIFSSDKIREEMYGTNPDSLETYNIHSKEANAKVFTELNKQIKYLILNTDWRLLNKISLSDIEMISSLLTKYILGETDDKIYSYSSNGVITEHLISDFLAENELDTLYKEGEKHVI